MAIARVNTSATFATGNSTTVASSATSLTAGNLIVALARAGATDQLCSSVTDTAGNTYRRTLSITFTSTTMELWYATNVSGNASNVVTANLTGNYPNRGLLTAQYSGFTSAVQFQALSGSYDSLGSITCDPFNTQTSDALILSCAQINDTGSTWTPGTGYTSAVEDASTVQIISEKIASSLQSLVTVTMTNDKTAALIQIVAVFAEPAAVASTRAFPFLG